MKPNLLDSEAFRHALSSALEHLQKEHLARSTNVLLDTLVATKQKLCYTEAAEIVGYNPRDSRFWGPLVDSMERDHIEGFPFRCSLIFNKRTGRPGSTYFDRARSLGCKIDRELEAEMVFWREQLQALGLDP